MNLVLLLMLRFFTVDPAAVIGQGDIKVRVTQVNTKKGEVMLALFGSPKGFPYETSYAIQKIKGNTLNGVLELSFSHIPPGTYAIALFHDTNGDGKLNTNFMGIPKEGYGVSNNTYNTFSAPGYKESSFSHKDGTELTIQMKY
ncbi:MAG TPA: DUF2141 domain-containing protein [Chitinophagaceae bacterium]|nr:DUF2141 domain-containing protein [Chitinophagaceae bacterium]